MKTVSISSIAFLLASGAIAAPATAFPPKKQTTTVIPISAVEVQANYPRPDLNLPNLALLETREAEPLTEMARKKQTSNSKRAVRVGMDGDENENEGERGRSRFRHHRPGRESWRDREGGEYGSEWEGYPRFGERRHRLRDGREERLSKRQGFNIKGVSLKEIRGGQHSRRSEDGGSYPSIWVADGGNRNDDVFRYEWERYTGDVDDRNRMFRHHRGWRGEGENSDSSVSNFSDDGSNKNVISKRSDDSFYDDGSDFDGWEGEGRRRHRLHRLHRFRNSSGERVSEDEFDNSNFSDGLSRNDVVNYNVEKQDQGAVAASS